MRLELERGSLVIGSSTVNVAPRGIITRPDHAIVEIDASSGVDAFRRELHERLRSDSKSLVRQSLSGIALALREGKEDA